MSLRAAGVLALALSVQDGRGFLLSKKTLLLSKHCQRTFCLALTISPTIGLKVLKKRLGILTSYWRCVQGHCPRFLERSICWQGGLRVKGFLMLVGGGRMILETDYSKHIWNSLKFYARV